MNHSSNKQVITAMIEHWLKSEGRYIHMYYHLMNHSENMQLIV